MRIAAAALALAAAVGSSPAVAQFDTGGMAARLRTGMSVDQVILALGYRPTDVTPDTACFLETGEPLICRVWSYTTDLQRLQIYFRYSVAQRRWLVYSWRL
ncbi:MAG: hypothetical protein JO032_12765 [Alphaproteobacteria bacterium]|nr:hypothetical protein [Alphaproteobacteria bacterium]MBV9553650.1 hypothetical protein [Alphaproteobacteria bacterium]